MLSFICIFFEIAAPKPLFSLCCVCPSWWKNNHAVTKVSVVVAFCCWTHEKFLGLFFPTVCSSSFKTEFFSKQPNVKHYFGFYGEGFLFFYYYLALLCLLNFFENTPSVIPLRVFLPILHTLCCRSECIGSLYIYIYSMRISFSCFLTIKYMVWV